MSEKSFDRLYYIHTYVLIDIQQRADISPDAIILRKSYTFALETVATISRVAGTLKTAESIRTVGKNITGPVLALVLVCLTKVINIAR